MFSLAHFVVFSGFPTEPHSCIQIKTSAFSHLWEFKRQSIKVREKQLIARFNFTDQKMPF
jgi:hypothetical protein